MYIHVYNKRPTCHNGHLSKRDSTEILSKGLMFAYQQPNHLINKNHEWLRKRA